MLVLSRKLGERIVVGHDIILTVVDVRGDRIRLGIEAPKGVPIHREEVFNRIQDESPATIKPRLNESPYIVECA